MKVLIAFLCCGFVAQTLYYSQVRTKSEVAYDQVLAQLQKFSFQEKTEDDFIRLLETADQTSLDTAEALWNAGSELQHDHARFDNLIKKVLTSKASLYSKTHLSLARLYVSTQGRMVMAQGLMQLYLDHLLQGIQAKSQKKALHFKQRNIRSVVTVLNLKDYMKKNVVSQYAKQALLKLSEQHLKNLMLKSSFSAKHLASFLKVKEHHPELSLQRALASYPLLNRNLPSSQKNLQQLYALNQQNLQQQSLGKKLQEFLSSKKLDPLKPLLGLNSEKIVFEERFQNSYLKLFVMRSLMNNREKILSQPQRIAMNESINYLTQATRLQYQNSLIARVKKLYPQQENNQKREELRVALAELGQYMPGRNLRQLLKSL